MSRTHPAFAPRRGGTRLRWWGKAWQAAVEESTYGEAEVRNGRRMARAGKVGAIECSPGGYVAVVTEGLKDYQVHGEVQALDADSLAAFVEVVAAEAGRIGALIGGDLPRRLAEDAEELGVELVPASPDLVFRCSCEPWADPCAHAVAVATQVGWLIDADPLLLVGLRGAERDDLLERLAARRERVEYARRDVDLGVEEVDVPNGVSGSGGPVTLGSPDPEDPAWPDLLIAEEAALRAERWSR